MMAEAVGIGIRDDINENQEELVNLLAKAFLLAEGDAKTAFARAMLVLMN